ncbi:DUF6331 family protein [Cupriavidus basilensis]|uniref:DUF6331 family protein n=1 Tax=Cupriavidus basilensis TaxID=68895 RepID=UPI00157BAD92|nr:DUF6331 family protein [Cupriavidus basilensis]NUA31864.1 hypothetical protein [Cupriavidus basilensis]
MANQGDISIGEDKWIPFIDLQGKYHDAVDIDEWLAPILPLLDWLETECIAGCCGIDAVRDKPRPSEGRGRIARTL